MLQNDIVGLLPKIGGFSCILTGMELLTGYMFALPLASITVETVCKYLMQWFMRHSYIPTLVSTDQGTQSTSKILRTDLLVPDFMREPVLIDRCIGEASYSPWNDNRKVVVQIRINKKNNRAREN